MVENINIDIIKDEGGRKKAVQIAYSDWQKIEKDLKELLEYRSMKASLNIAFLEVQQMQAGQLPKF